MTTNTTPIGADALRAKPPGIDALQCVIASLRDTAHFSDEEGELTNDLRTLRDWALAQVAQEASAVPDTREMFNAGWCAAARFCDREDAVYDGLVGPGGCPAFEAAYRAALSAAPQPAAQQGDALSYVHPVPDHCDRVVWRNRYLHLNRQEGP